MEARRKQEEEERKRQEEEDRKMVAILQVSFLSNNTSFNIKIAYAEVFQKTDT